VNGHFASRYRKYRQPGQHKFSLNVIDSEAAYGAQGLLVMESIRQAKKATSKRALIGQLRDFTQSIQSYSAPADLGYLRLRAKQRGDNTVRLVETMIGKMLKVSPIIYGMRNQIGLSAQPRGHQNAIDMIAGHAMASIKKGMASPYINLSYGGDLEDLEHMESIAELKYVAEQHGCRVYSSVARLSSLINLGPKNFSLSFASNDPDFVIDSK
jgi:fatty acid-binding protein DegV